MGQLEIENLPLPRGVGHDLPWRATPAHAQVHSLGLTVAEVAALLSALPTDRYRHGLMEGLRVRVKEVDSDHGVVVVGEAESDKDRVVMLPRSLAAELRP